MVARPRMSSARVWGIAVMVAVCLIPAHTTFAQGRVIQGITAKASNSLWPERHPNNLLNANGMDPTETYFYNTDGSQAGEPTSGNDVEWVTTSIGLNADILAEDKVWVVFDLGDILPVARLDLWNWQWNHPSVGDLSNRGMAQFDVYVRVADADTDDGTAAGTPINVDQVFDSQISAAVPFDLGTVNPWELVLEDQVLNQAPNTDTHTATGYDLGNRLARFVAIKVDDWYGGNGCALGKARFYTVSDTAHSPSPGHDADDVLRDVTLTWKPGEQVVTHDVYWGTTFDDVNDGTVPSAAGLDVNTIDVGLLSFGQTYYWRVDEISGAPDDTVFKGDVWRFTVEPVAIGVVNVTATASGANVDMGPEKTVDGSGLNDLGQHSMIPADMWLTQTDGSWIQYTFDKAHKLHDMRIWNSNQAIETFIGFGVNDALVETSLDGVTWTPVEGVGPFAQGTGLDTYEANTFVDLGGIMATQVRITPQSTFIPTGQVGLSEVRFTRIPTEAREFSPADGSTSEHIDVTLSWRAGREAAVHEVYRSTDPDALALAGITAAPSLGLVDLEYGQTYYWQVVEVNEAETPARYASDILSFSTPAFALVDDFESYSDQEGQEVFVTWLDGYGGDTSLGGSTTGHIDGPFVETTLVNPGTGGRQSMPVYIDNDGSFVDIDGNTHSPAFSEVVREFDPVQDWSGNGLGTLSIMFAGSTDLTGQLYVKINNLRVDYADDVAHLGSGDWTSWTIDLSTVGTDLQKVASLAIGVEGPGESRILYIDDIRLYPPVATPVSSQALQGVRAKASNSYSEARHPNNLLNANGMDPTGIYFYNTDGSEAGEPTSGNDTEWVTTSNGLNATILAEEKVWIVFDLGDIMTVTRLDLWNWQWNHPSVGDLSNRGLARFDVYLRATDADTDNGTAAGAPINVDQVFNAGIDAAVPFERGTVDPWQRILEDQTLAQAPNTDEHTATSYDLGGVSARFIAIVAKDWYAGNGVGLGKVRVYSVSGD